MMDDWDRSVATIRRIEGNELTPCVVRALPLARANAQWL